MSTKKAYNREALEEFYTAAVEANKINNSKAIQVAYNLFNDLPVGDIFETEPDIILEALNMVPDGFYDLIASQMVSSLNTNPFSWSALDGEIYYIITEERANYVNKRVIQLGYRTDAEYYFQAMDYMEQGSYDMAQFYLNQIELESPLLRYLLGNCYDAEENYEKAIRQYDFYLEQVQDILSAIENKNMVDSLPTVHNNYVVVQLRLLSILNHLKYYQKSLQLSSEMLSEWTIDDLSKSFHNSEHSKDSSNYTEFEIFCMDYAYALDKTKGSNEAAIFLDKAIQSALESDILANQIIHYKERAVRQGTADEIISTLRPPKRAFDISKFTSTSRIAREKNLEDLIVEQIKYGFEVFGRKLELYQNETFYGRQFRLQDNSILDLLLIEKSNDTLYVVELKRHGAGIEVYYQTSNYINLVKETTDKTVKGIICLHEFNQELVELVKKDQDMELFTYNFNFKKQA